MPVSGGLASDLIPILPLFEAQRSARNDASSLYRKVVTGTGERQQESVQKLHNLQVKGR